MNSKRSYRKHIAIAVAVSAAIVVSLRPNDSITTTVIYVSDGDTIQVNTSSSVFKVRIYGIDCPEKSQPYGPEARSFTTAQTLGKSVTLRIHDKDRYGRIIASVKLPNGDDLAESLLKNGLAWWYRQYAPHNWNLSNLEVEARNKKVGLWSKESPVPPWIFRAEK